MATWLVPLFPEVGGGKGAAPTMVRTLAGDPSPPSSGQHLKGLDRRRPPQRTFPGLHTFRRKALEKMLWTSSVRA